MVEKKSVLLVLYGGHRTKPWEGGQRDLGCTFVAFCIDKLCQIQVPRREIAMFTVTKGLLSIAAKSSASFFEEFK